MTVLLLKVVVTVFLVGIVDAGIRSGGLSLMLLILCRTVAVGCGRLYLLDIDIFDVCCFHCCF